MLRSQRIHNTLEAAFSPQLLEVVDDSARHAGHAGASEAGETHYNVRIVSTNFAGQSRVAMQRAVMDALKSEFGSGLHALSIKASAAIPVE
ncbi:MAG: BolA family transcriptional regulator [Henriciella sp.]